MNTVDITPQSVALEREASREDRAARLRYRLASAGGSWGDEFRLLLALADERGVSLNAEILTFSDVRDLQALQQRIATARTPRSGWLTRR